MNILLKTSLVAVLTLSALASHAQQKLLPAQSEIVFVSKQMGVPVEGRFKKFDAQISFDAAKLATSKVSFAVDIGSATLGAPEADAELPKPAWFNVAKFPQATFNSASIKALGGGKFEVAGKLAIKGQSRDVTVPVTMVQTGAGAALVTTASGTLPIKRLAYLIGEGEWSDTSTVADDVLIKFKFALNGIAKL